MNLLPFKKIAEGLDLREDWFRQGQTPFKEIEPGRSELSHRN